MKYKIYKLVYNGVVVYVGRTTLTLKKRKGSRYKGTSVESIYKECDIELIEETDDVSRERYWIDEYKDTVLNIRSGEGLNRSEYMKEYREANKERNKESRKERDLKNREKILEYQKQYRLKNKERISQVGKERYQKCKLRYENTTR